MTSHGAGSQLVPIIHGPSEFVDHGGKGKASICRTTGDHDLRPLTKGLDDGPCAGIDIGGQQTVTNLDHRLAGLHVTHLMPVGDQLVDPR